MAGMCHVSQERRKKKLQGVWKKGGRRRMKLKQLENGENLED